MLGIGGAGVALAQVVLEACGLSNQCSIHQKIRKKMRMNSMVKYNRALPHRRKNM